VASALRPLDSQKDLEDLSLFAEKGRNEVLGNFKEAKGRKQNDSFCKLFDSTSS
jgi:hypothetical protein